MTQAPTPGPLSAFRVDLGLVATTIETMHRRIEDLTGSRQSQYDGAVALARDLYLSAPTAPVEASGSERDFGDSIIDCEIAREAFDSRPQPSGETRWTEDMERERREADYERGFRDGQNSGPQPSGETREWSQEQHDHEALTAVAEHLRDNPAAPYSGRQCEEFVLSAQDEGAGERERYLRENLDVVWRSVEDMAKTCIQMIASSNKEYATEDRDRARIDFIGEVCRRWSAHPSPTPAADADRVRIAARALLDACIKDFGDPAEFEGDDGSVARSKSGGCAVTFKHMRDLDGALKSTAAKEGGEG